MNTRSLTMIVSMLLIATFALALSSSVSNARTDSDQKTRFTKSSVNIGKNWNALSSAQNRQVFARAFKDHFSEEIAEANASGVSFIAPFFSNDDFGIANFSPAGLELASFNADLNDQDFYRENNDGTVSVHVNSNTADVAYFANLFDPTALTLFGSGAHYSANYTGPVIEFTLPNGDIIRFVDLNSGFNRALSIHGNGKAEDAGTGQIYKVSIDVVNTPSGKQRAVISVR